MAVYKPSFADAILRKNINIEKQNFVNFYISNIYDSDLAHIS